MLIESDYSEVRAQMQPGDIIAFGGKGHFSQLIKMATRGPVSHVGIILQTVIAPPKVGDFTVSYNGGSTATEVVIQNEDRFFNNIIESTSLNGFSGVVVNRLSDRLTAYDGEVWWLPLSDEVRGKMDTKAFYDFAFAQKGKEYDTYQAVRSAIDLLGETDEDYGRFFCSELCAASLEHSGAVPKVNASEVTPMNLVRLNIFGTDYHQIKGDEPKAGDLEKLLTAGRFTLVDIPGYNSIPYERWDV